ncbi:TspO/MBR family protein [Neobacillus sp. PS3-34]|uniref:TspO/MBR family protein n=1 Tax=Neobacillus sp. PS3-34 TaxID=3070678 RepID=UPI0027E1B03C|nr:TspO/MBR family protein [Neobacillus sp. PS3-34]WML50473.1 TspO/MBR family protein [Neobacillus sp. PS3-34]
MDILKVNGKIEWGKLAVNVLIPVVGGSMAGYFATKSAPEIYRSLEKPSFAPPSWVFPAVWTGLYTLMGYANYRVSVKGERLAEAKQALIPYCIQLGLNFLWSFLFFKWSLRGTAFIEISLLLAVLTLTTYRFYQTDKQAGVAMMPYLAWVAFALGLNYSMWKLN